MDPEKTHIIYSAEDIQKYFSGNLSPAEMHAMEKAALEDAFLAEAMEGYEGMQEKEWDETLLLLKDKFLKGPPAKVIPMKAAPVYRILKLAAVILFIFGGVAVTYLLTNKEPASNKPLAVISSKSDSVTGVTGSHTDSVVATETTSINTPKVVTRREKQVPKPSATIRPMADSTFIYRPGKAEKKEEITVAGGGYVDDQLKAQRDFASSNTTPTSQNALETSVLKNNEIARQSSKETEKSKKDAPDFTRRFSAQVIGQDGSPLPFANISISNEHFGTYADAKGNFRLVSPDSLLTVEIKSAGYISRNFTLRSDVTPNKIVLAEDELALKEKTMVSGKFNAYNKTRRSVLVADTLINVEPADGWDNYDRYLANNLSLSNEIIDKKIHGEVEVSFDVQRNGVLSNIKIDKSLCNDCDEAALRAIKEGPRWKIKKGDKATGKVKVRF